MKERLVDPSALPPGYQSHRRDQADSSRVIRSVEEHLVVGSLLAPSSCFGFGHSAHCDCGNLDSHFDFATFAQGGGGWGFSHSTSGVTLSVDVIDERPWVPKNLPFIEAKVMPLRRGRGTQGSGSPSWPPTLSLIAVRAVGFMIGMVGRSSTLA